jgi:tetratricopeptide (TPR) repeat protein
LTAAAGIEYPQKEQNSLQLVSLAEAVDEIRRTARSPDWPFFFMVGAGISVPSVPTASAIVADCRSRYSLTSPPPGLSPMREYSWWLEKAFPSPGPRREYFQKLIEGKPIPSANFRLAHLLLDKKISNLVVTTNFDDFLSRSLDLFGTPHAVCDHPATIQRIKPSRNEIQIVHVHGSYWFYDLANLEEEIAHQAELSSTSTYSMRQFLEGLLNVQSPLVVGYSGWEGDVFMSALKRRLAAPLEYKVYWFWHQRAAADDAPQWLKDSANVLFVVPPVPAQKEEGERSVDRLMKAGSAMAAEKRDPSALDANEVFESLIRAFELEEPELTRDPLVFYAGHLRRNLPREDAYLLESTAGRIERAAALLNDALEGLDRSWTEMESFIRRSQYRDALQSASAIRVADLTREQLRGLMDNLWTAATGLNDNSPEELNAYDLIQEVAERAGRLEVADEETKELLANALISKGVVLGELGRYEEALVPWDEVLERYAEDPAPTLREQVAKAFYNKGVTLRLLERNEEAVAAYGEVLKRYSEDSAPALRERVAMALLNKGVRLGELGRGEEEIAAYDEVLKRYGEDPGPALRKEVASAMFNKGVALGELGRGEEEVAEYDEVLERFGEDSAPALRESVAKALYNKGFTLGQLGRDQEAIAAYDELLKRYGEDPTPAPRESVAKALFNKGVRLGKLGHSDERLAVLHDLIARFGEDAAPAIRDIVARARKRLGLEPGEPESPPAA